MSVNPLPQRHINNPNPTRKKTRATVKLKQPKIGIKHVAAYGLLTTMAIMVIAGFAGLNSLNNQVAQKEQKIKELNEEREMLEMEAARLKSFDRIEDIAVNELGMEYPEGNYQFSSRYDRDDL